MTVDEGRGRLGLPGWPDADGSLTIAEFIAKHEAVVSKSADATDGGAETQSASPAPAKDQA